MAGVSLATWAAVAGASVAAVSAVSSADAQRTAAHTAADKAKQDAKDHAAQLAAMQKPIDAPPGLQSAAAVPTAMRQTGGPTLPSPTMLTGPAGVDPGSLNLGKNTLLGS